MTDRALEAKKSFLLMRKESAQRNIESNLDSLEDGIVKARRILGEGGNDPIFTTFTQVMPFLCEAAGKHAAILEALSVLEALEKKL